MEDDSHAPYHHTRAAGPEDEYRSHRHHHHTHSRESTSYRSSRSHHHHPHHDHGETAGNRPANLSALVIAPVLIVLLLLAPVFYFLYDENRKLERENDLFRSEITRLATENETLEKAALGDLRTSRDEPRLQPAGTTAQSAAGTSPARTAPRFATGPQTPSAPSKTSAAGLSSEKQDILRKEMRLAPDGSIPDGENGASGRRADSCAPVLETAFYALSRGAAEDAAVTLEGLVESKSLWPYGHFYLAVATGSETSFRQAQILLLEARILRALPPEGELYLALVSLFLKDKTMAKEALARLEAQEPDYARLPLGPLFAPSDAGKEALDHLRALPGLPAIQLLGKGPAAN